MATLNDGKRHLLNEYLQEKRGLIEANNPSAVEVAEWCRDILKFAVDVGNVTSRVGPEGVLYKHEWPGSETSRKGRLTDRAKQLLIIEQVELTRRELKRLGVSLGEPSFGRSYKGWDELATIAKTDIADIDQREDIEK